MNIGTNDEQQSILQNQAETTDTCIPSVEHIETKDQQQTTLPKEYNSETIILCDSNGHRAATLNSLFSPKASTKIPYFSLQVNV
jgi:hypothetical protein